MNNINLRVSKIAAIFSFVALPWAAEAARISWEIPVSGAFQVGATFSDDGTGSVVGGAFTLTPGAKTGDIVAEQGVPAEPPLANPASFAEVLQPFQARSFATGFLESHAGIGPLGIAEAPDGTFLVSGGPSRNQLFRFEQDGGSADQFLA